MRQKDDVRFAETLNRIREGNTTAEDIDHIKSRLTSTDDTEFPHDALHLFTSNEKVDSHNKKVIENLKTKGSVAFATDFVIGNIPAEAKETILSIARDLPAQKTQNLRQLLQLKIGAKYMLTHNIDTADGLTNGALCTVMDLAKKCVWVLFEDKEVGHNCRQTKRSLYAKGISKLWTPVLTVDKQFQVGRNQDVKVIRRQYPLTPCAALTIHKSQGSSLGEAVVSFSGKRAPGAHMVYVALSRVTHLLGLHLLDFSKSHIKTDEKVKEEMKRLRTSRQIHFLGEKLVHDENKLIIASLNTRSLHKHHKDIMGDSVLKAIHVLVILESWLIQTDKTDDYCLPDFPFMIRLDIGNQRHSFSRPHGGIVVYSKINTVLKAEIKRGKSHIVILEITKSNDSVLNVAIIYRHHSTKIEQFINMLEESLCTCSQQNDRVILGDFNIDRLKSSADKKTLLNFLESRNSLKSVINKETTDFHTCIDHIYSNVEDCVGDVAETYWSDHKFTWISL